MKVGIHPNYVDSKVICACGATFETKSTKPEIHVEVCAQCHPFYTKKQNSGRSKKGTLDKFYNRLSKSQTNEK